MNTQQFLDLIHGPGALIYFQVGSKTWRNKPQTFEAAEQKLRWRNSEGDGICFVVNGGGTRDAQITKINAVFIDWDCGRDCDGRYHAPDVVAQNKAAFLPKLNGFVPKASLVVETRNGFHAYWLVSDATTAQFRDCQQRLAHHFGADPTVCNPARVLRLPGFNWCKGGYEPFPVRVILIQIDDLRLVPFSGRCRVTRWCHSMRHRDPPSLTLKGA